MKANNMYLKYSEFLPAIRLLLTVLLMLIVPRLIAQPSSPTNLQATALNGAIILSWDLSNPLPIAPTNYNIYRSVDGSTFGAISHTANFSSFAYYIDNTAINGTKYWYKVTAYQGSYSNESGASNVVTVMPKSANNFYVLALNNANEIHWPASTTGATGYRLYKSTDSLTFAPIVPDFPAGITQYTDDGLTNGQFYFYRIAEIGGSKDGILSNTEAASPEADLSKFTTFTGTNYLFVPDSFRLSKGTYNNNLSIECWYKPASINLYSSKQSLLSRSGNNAYSTGDENEAYALFLANNGDSTFFAFNSWTYLYPSTLRSNAISANTWYHIAVVNNPSLNTCTMYVNGAVVGTTSAITISDYEGYKNMRLFIGAIADAEYGYTGEMRELRIWQKALSQTEITTNMNQRLRGDESQLLGIWHLDKMYNNIAYDYTTNDSYLKNAIGCGTGQKAIANNDYVKIPVNTTNKMIDVQENDSISIN